MEKFASRYCASNPNQVQPREVTYLCIAGLRIRIRIQSGQWIRIRIRNPDPDPGGQKLPTKEEFFFLNSCFEVLDGLF